MQLDIQLLIISNNVPISRHNDSIAILLKYVILLPLKYLKVIMLEYLLSKFQRINLNLFCSLNKYQLITMMLTEWSVTLEYTRILNLLKMNVKRSLLFFRRLKL